MHPQFPSRHRNSHGRKRFAQWCLRRFRTQGCSLGVSRRFLLISQCIQFLRAYGQTCRVLFHVKRVVSAFDPARSYPHLLWMIVDNRWITHPTPSSEIGYFSMVLQISTAQEHADVHIVDNSVDNQNAPPLHVVVELREISMNLSAPSGSGRWSSTMELVGWARGPVRRG